MTSISQCIRLRSFAILLLASLWGGACTGAPPAGDTASASISDSGTLEPAASSTEGEDTLEGTTQSATEGDTETATPDATQSDTASADTAPEACIPRPTARWTLMLYEDADNNLESVLLDDVNEAEAADIPDDINVIVLLDRAAGYDKRDGNWKGARLYRLTKDDDLTSLHSERLADPVHLGLSSTSDNGEELNMGSAEVLKGFIDFALECFPAQHTLLHLSDHGDGWRKLNGGSQEPAVVRGICQDDSSGKLLSVSEDLPAALAGRHFDAITFDACIMGTVEVAWALAPFADYFGASVMNVPNTGFDYTLTLNGWLDNPTAERWVARSVEAFQEYYADQKSVGFTAVDLRALKAFGEALDAMLEEAQGLSADDFRPIRNQAYRPDPLQLSMRDARDLLSRFDGVVSDATLAAVLDAYDATIVSLWYSSNVERIQGLSIYAPGAAIVQGGPYLPAYDKTPFAQDSQWNEFIKARLASSSVDSDTSSASDGDTSTP